MAPGTVAMLINTIVAQTGCQSPSVFGDCANREEWAPSARFDLTLRLIQ
jgi:hypothetical protein